MHHIVTIESKAKSVSIHATNNTKDMKVEIPNVQKKKKELNFFNFL
jgi:hypothetical protein